MRRNVANESEQVPENKVQVLPGNDGQRRERPVEPERMSRLMRFCVSLSYAKYIFFVLMIPPILNYGALNRESDALFPQGEKVDVGWGQKMFISCLGEGIPTVILDAPTGTSSDVWIEAQMHIAEFTKVCIYDRSGIGFSDLPFLDASAKDEHSNTRRYVAQPSTVQQMVDDLHYLITKSKPLQKPFIIVGSEIASLIARYYAHVHEEDVAGIVLIDPFVENMFTLEKGSWHEYWNSHLLPLLMSLHLSATLGLSRLALLLGLLPRPLSEGNVSEDVTLRQKYLLCNPTHLNAAFNEYLHLNTSFTQMNDLLQAVPFPESVSATVIDVNYYEKYPHHLIEVWKKSHQYLMENLHHDCYHRIVEVAEHGVLYTKPVIIIEQIKKIIATWREQQKISFSFVD